MFVVAFLRAALNVLAVKTTLNVVTRTVSVVVVVVIVVMVRIVV